MKRWTYIAIALVLAVAAMVPASLRLDARFDLAAYNFDNLTPQEQGAVTFLFYDWGALNGDTLRTNAVPWKLAEAALALQRTDGDRLAAAALTPQEIFRPFGFHMPDRVANWPDDIATPVLDGPLGVVRAQSGGLTPLSVEISNIACAACHSATVYRADGSPDVGAVWLGGTNASLDLGAYTSAMFDGFLTSEDALMDVATARFPDMSVREAATLRTIILPALMTEVRGRDTAVGALLPFTPSHVGATNGYDSLRLRLGLIAQNAPVDQSYFTSIPALGGRMWRSRFLTSGVYTLPDTDHTQTITSADMIDARFDELSNIISYFLLPSMGVTAQVAIEQQDAARPVTAWIADYTPQPFPAPIDPTKASQGQQIYTTACAACHGTYDTAQPPALVSFPNWEGDIGTDAGPPLSQIEAIADAINASPYGPYLAARPTTLRSAPPLTGLWASAPYLANGSVPTLWHLMRPALRPDTFAIGGHRLDMARVGIDLTPPATYVPWSTARLFDSNDVGKSNAGHAIGFDRLSEADKDALLEFLKQL